MDFESAGKTEKVSDHIIDQIRDAVLAGRLKPGDRLGSEKELVDRFGVSKATTREALRVLEAMGLVEIRKGVQGGVFIAEVDMKTTIHSMMNFLHFRSFSIREITMLRFMLEPSVAYLAARSITEEEVADLERLVEAEDSKHQTDLGKEIGFHRALARLSKNPMLVLIMDFVDNILSDYKHKLNLTPEFYGQVKESHNRILECLKDKDCVGARREISADLLSVGNYLADLTNAERFDPEVMGCRASGIWAASDVFSETENDSSSETREPAVLHAVAGGKSNGAGKKPVYFRQVDSGDLFMLVQVDETDEEQATKRLAGN